MQLVRQATRSLRRSPGYSSAIVASLALGIGLNTAIFGVMEDVLRRPLPYPDESQLVTAGKVARSSAVDAGQIPSPNWEMDNDDLRAWRQGSRTLESFAVVSNDYRVVAGRVSPEYVEGAQASPDLLRVLRVQTAHGRWFAPDEVSTRVVVLSHGLWKRQFAGDVAAIGQVLTIQGEPWTVIGVMSRGAEWPLNAAYWVPFKGMAGQVVARPRAGIPLTQVGQELAALSPGVANLRRAGYSAEIVVMSLHERLFGPARPVLRLLFGAAALLLLIACANVANLSLARTLERRRELAVRLTLGASRRSLAALVLTENLLLAIVGAALGTVLAFWGTAAVVALGPEEIARVPRLGINATSALFAGAAAMLITLLVSIAPVVTATDRGVQPLLAQAGARTGRGRTSQRIRRLLVVTQLALALLLITGAGLLIRSVARLTRVDHLGFTPKGVVIASVHLFGSDYQTARRRDEFVRELTARVSALPTVQSVAFGPPPLVGGRGDALREGFSVILSYRDTMRARSRSTTVWVKHIDVGYLEAFRIRLRAGRAFRVADDSAATRVALLSAAGARLFFRDRDPIGQTLALPALIRGGSPPPRVIGIVDDVLQRDLTMEVIPEILLPIAQQPATSRMPTLAVRTSAPTAAILGPLRQALRATDPDLAATRLEPMDAVVNASLSRHTFLLSLLAIFAGLGLALSLIGLYAVVSYLVTQRTLEIGVRLALGAQQRDVLRLVLGEGALLILIGIAVGIPAALALTHFLTSFLYEVKPHDVATFAAAPIALAMVALVAAYVPARRAAGLDPARTLRTD